jgi:dihydrolipoamide dehydrogenase
MKQYEVVVIGGGPGGYTAALHAAGLGKKTALIEANFLGGTCLNRGCIPSKTWLKQAEVIESIEKARDWGIDCGDVVVSLDKMKKRKDDVITRLRKGIAFLLRQGNIDIFNGYGSIVGSNQIKVQLESSTEELYANKIIIATGSSPMIPPINGLDTVQFDTSDTIFDIKEIPSSVVIIGGGVIGVEFACIFASLKTEVTIVEMSDRIIPSEDEEASSLLEKLLKKKNIKILTSSKVTKVDQAGEMTKTTCVGNDGRELIIESDTLIVSVGRKPNLSAVQQLDLTYEGPFIKVNEKMETSVTNVYAIGDVIGGYQLAHVASAEGIVAASNAADIEEKIEYKVVPRCIYTLPEVASVGLTEREAKAKGLLIRTERFDHVGNGKALAIGETNGFVKIVYDEVYGEIIGATMVGPSVTEIISEASAFMFLEGTVQEVAKMIHPHPSVTESFFEATVKIVNKMRKDKIIV